MTLTWQPDVLGDDFEQAMLSTSDGAAVTLVRFLPSTNNPVAVLYVHGFVDYFFHPHVAQALSDAGYAFYAVELRGYGRSMAAHVAAGRLPNNVPDIAEHVVDLQTAVQAVGAEGHTRLVILAHSMGGLITTLWADQRRRGFETTAVRSPVPALRGAAPEALEGQPPVEALVLNSPWFDLNENALLRGPVSTVIRGVSHALPNLVVSSLKPYYGRALHVATGGEWNYDLRWKPHEGFPVRASWLASIRRAQHRLNSGELSTGVPTLVLSSDRTGPHRTQHGEEVTTDSVLSVEQIQAGARHLGAELVIIAKGAHDLALSPEPARDEYLAAVTTWLATHVTTGS
jgi:alpha-beta hydrolase superfamily lysophospholipase